MHQDDWAIFSSSPIRFLSPVPGCRYYEFEKFGSSTSRSHSWSYLVFIILMNILCTIFHFCSVDVISSTRFFDVSTAPSLLFVSSRTGFHFWHRKAACFVVSSSPQYMQLASLSFPNRNSMPCYILSLRYLSIDLNLQSSHGLQRGISSYVHCTLVLISSERCCSLAYYTSCSCHTTSPPMYVFSFRRYDFQRNYTRRKLKGHLGNRTKRWCN